MSKKADCNIVRDLLPSYIDELCSDESKAYIEEHLSVCAECREVYNMMNEDDVAEEEISIDQKKIIDGVRDRMRKDKKRKAIVFTGFLVAVIAVVLVLITPFKTIPRDSINLEVYSYKPSECIGEKAEFSSDNQNAIYMVDPAVDIDKATFYKLESDNNRAGLDIYMEENWIKTHEDFSIVFIDSEYTIKKYSCSINDDNGRNILKLKGKTTITAKPQEGVHTIHFIVPERVDSWSIAY